MSDTPKLDARNESTLSKSDLDKINAVEAGLVEAELPIEQRLNMQTAKIAWAELARFFASGKAIRVDASLDLIQVAVAMHNDYADEVGGLMQKGLVALVSDEQAISWLEADAHVWAVVVSPWVLVQSK